MAVLRHPLGQNDAVVLAHAVAARVAVTVGSRALAIKGFVAETYGLRPSRVSSDADVLVEPAAWESYISTLQDYGWRRRETSTLGSAVVTHSVSFTHSDWPCDIDVHRRFPGFLGDDTDVFSELWRRRIATTQADVPIWIPDRSSAILIGVLHAMRTPAQSARHLQEFRSILKVCLALDTEKRTDIARLAVATGANEAARPFLGLIGVELAAPVPHGVDPALDEWRARVSADGHLGAQAWIATTRLPWRKRPAALWSVLWPRARDFRLDHPDVAPGHGAMLRARFARLGRGVRQLPVVIRGRMQAKRGITESSLVEDET